MVTAFACRLQSADCRIRRQKKLHFPDSYGWVRFRGRPVRRVLFPRSVLLATSPPSIFATPTNTRNRDAFGIELLLRLARSGNIRPNSRNKVAVSNVKK